MQALSFSLLTLVLATVGLNWIPVFAVGSFAIELANVVSLLAVAVLPFVIVPKFYFPRLFLLFYLLILCLMAAFAIHGGDELFLLARTVLGLTAAVSIANLSPLRTQHFARAVAISYAAFGSCVTLASFIAGHNLIVAILEYLTSLNRSAFVYGFIRPTFNAFSDSAELTYLASTINTFSGAFVIFFNLALLNLRAGWSMYVVMLSSFLVIFILFSTSSVLALLLTVGLAAGCWLIKASEKGLPIIATLGAIVVLVLMSGDLVEYIALNVLADNSSRGARLDQYMAAVNLVNAGFGIGHGYVTVNGHGIHNLLLFSAVTGGLIPGLLVVAIYALAISMAVGAAISFMRTNDRLNLAVFGLVTFFVIRITFGGGGGLPGGPATVALGLAFYLQRQVVIQAAFSRLATKGLQAPKTSLKHPAGSVP